MLEECQLNVCYKKKPLRKSFKVKSSVGYGAITKYFGNVNPYKKNDVQ